MSKLHFQCKTCGKVQPIALLRFFPATLEARTADLIQNPDAPLEPYIRICRDCWVKAIAEKKRPELVSIIEMLSCDLLEIARTTEAVVGNKMGEEPCDSKS